jgi:TolB-like protein/DNA-binding winged helix-turn-helix (wHTH) protein/Flp pilus assembly protein TadD
MLPQSAQQKQAWQMRSFANFRLDAVNHSLWRGSERVAITPKAFDVLRHLVENAGRLVSQDALLEALWPETYVNPEVLRKYILEIRKVLGDRPDKPVFIETLTKRGYRFIAPVTDESNAEALASPISDTTQESERSGPALLEQKALGGKDTPSKLAVPVVLVAIAFALVAGYFWIAGRKASARSSRDNTSIAVLPFADLSPGKDQEYFSDGLSEQVINDLASVAGLKVVARSSAFQFKGKNEDLRKVGQKLGVANVLEGSVRKDGDRVRITAELVKVDDGFQLWSETYDREIDDAFAAQDEIARAVTQALQVRLLPTDGAEVWAKSRSRNPEAYQAYLQGEYFVARGQDKEDLQKALAYADQAVKLDATYAPAWAQRAQVLQGLARVALIPDAEGFRAARESASRAIALDPNLDAGYLALGLVQINYDWDWEGADISLKKAGLLEPGSAAVLANRAYLARTLGQVEESIALYKQAIALDPLRANFHLSLGYELYLVGRYEEAHAALQKAQELNPQLSSLHLTSGKILLSEGRKAEALAEMEKETGEWEKLSGESLAYFALGRNAESDEALKKLIATHQNDCAYQVAEAYAFRGETEKAFQWLNRAFRQRDPGTPELKTGQLVQSLRPDPRYAELLKRMHLPG